MRGQALAIAMVVVSGVATLVMALSTYDSMMQTRDSYYREYRFAEVFASLKRAPESLARRMAELPGVAQVETRVVAGVNLDVPGFADPVRGRLVSLPDTGEPLLNAIYLRQGRLPDPQRDNEILISDAFFEAHDLALGDPLRVVINGRRKAMTIVGVALSPEYVYQLPPGAALPDPRRFGVLWMARTPLAAANDMEGAFNDLSLSLLPGARSEDVIARVDELLARYGGLGAYAREDQLSNRFLVEEMRGLRTTASIFPAIFLGVAAFLLNVALGRLIATQRDQIAILKAFGYGNVSVGWHYVKLVLLMTLLGVAGGVALGIWFGRALSNVYGDFYRFPQLDYVLEPYVIAIAVGVSVAAALSGTLMAVGRAVRLAPAEAMRPEAPAVYRATLIERLGLQRWLAQPTRMVFRHIERRPFKSLLTVIGIASAGGILIVGNFQRGAVDFMVDVQFYQSQREDLSLSFVEPTSRRALYSLTGLPGVSLAEGYRSVPVRLRFEHRSFRTAIRGVERDSRLMRVLDQRLQPIPLPAEGLVLSHYLGEQLGVQPGDRLTVEVLEGSRPVRQVPVVRLAKQYIGVGAYMQRPALNRLLREGEVISGALLRRDPRQEAALFAELKAMPRVLGVEQRLASVRSFYEDVAQMTLFFSGITVLLGMSIAFGVVYNSARIALSERGRELASLRVLGFTHGEIAYILLGELALLTLVAIPVGFVIGYALCWFLTIQFTSELYRIPLVVTPSNYALSAAVVLVSALLSGLIAWRRLGRLDLVEVLKTRE